MSHDSQVSQAQDQAAVDPLELRDVGSEAVPEVAAEDTEQSELGEGGQALQVAKRLMLDLCLLGMCMLLVMIVFGLGSGSVLALMAGGALEVMSFAGVVGLLIGVASAMVLQVAFIFFMARPVRLCSLLLVVWGLTLVPLCWIGVRSVLNPQYSGELNRFVFTRMETPTYVVGGLMLLELVAWLILVVIFVRRALLRARQ